MPAQRKLAELVVALEVISPEGNQLKVKEPTVPSVYSAAAEADPSQSMPMAPAQLTGAISKISAFIPAGSTIVAVPVRTIIDLICNGY
jgi:hypothetical protein